MNTLIKTSLIKTGLASALALGALAATTPAIAGQDGIVVQSPAAMEEWSQDVTRSLNRGIVQSERFSNTRARSGIVQLRFTLDDEGRADNVSLYRSSGHPGTDKIASRAVRKLSNLAEAPVRDASSKTFQANLIFATNADEHAVLAKKLDKMESARLARGGSEATVVTFGG